MNSATFVVYYNYKVLSITKFTVFTLVFTVFYTSFYTKHKSDSNKNYHANVSRTWHSTALELPNVVFHALVVRIEDLPKGLVVPLDCLLVLHLSHLGGWVEALRQAVAEVIARDEG